MLYAIVAIASLGGLLFGYETGVAGTALRHAADTLGPGSDALIYMSSGTLAGALCGALAGGWLSDRIGRRDVLMATAALFALGAFSSAIAPSAGVLIVARFIVGLGIGGVSAAAPTYIAEIAPAHLRGRLVTCFQLAITLGLFGAYLADRFLLTQAESWRLLLGLGVAPSLVLAGTALLLPESPLWLGEQGETGAAAKIASRLGCAHEAPVRASGAHGPESRRLFSARYRNVLFLVAGLFLFQQFVGINALIYFAPAIMGEGRLGGSALADPLNVAAVNVGMTVAALLLIDRLGRRPLLIASFAGCLAGLAAMIAGAAQIAVAGAGGGVLIAVGVYVFVAAFAVGLGPVPWVTAAEMTPYRARGWGLGVFAASHWLFDALASPLSLLSGGRIGMIAALCCAAVVSGVGLFLFRRVLPENSGLSLAQIDARVRALAALARKSGSQFTYYLATSLVTTGGLLNGFNFGVTAATLLLLTQQWSLDPFAQGSVAGVMILGLAAGSFIAGALSDRFGRRYLLMSTAALFVAGAFTSAIATSLGWLLLGRALVGFAIGVASPTTSVYVAEIAPSAIRGRLLSFEAITYGIGAILAYAVGIAFESDPDGWRFMFAVIAVPSTIYGLLLLPLPESPRWLARQGRMESARRVLRLFEERDVDRALAELSDQPAPRQEEEGWRALSSPVNRAPTTLGLVIMFLIVFCGWDMILFYAPVVLKEAGLDDTVVNFLATLGLSLVFLVMTLISASFVDRLGRRLLIIWGLAGMAACLAILAALSAGGGEPAPMTLWAMVATLAVFVGIFALTLGQVGEIVVAEIFPSPARGAGISLSHGMRSLFAFAFSATFPFTLSAAGLAPLFVVYAMINILGAVYLFRHLPETRALSLEDIEAFWRQRESAV